MSLELFIYLFIYHFQNKMGSPTRIGPFEAGVGGTLSKRRDKKKLLLKQCGTCEHPSFSSTCSTEHAHAFFFRVNRNTIGESDKRRLNWVTGRTGFSICIFIITDKREDYAEVSFFPSFYFSRKRKCSVSCLTNYLC